MLIVEMPEFSHLILEMNNVENAPCLTAPPFTLKDRSGSCGGTFLYGSGWNLGYPDRILKDKGARKSPQGIRLLGNTQSILIINTDYGVSLKQFQHLLSHVGQHN